MDMNISKYMAFVTAAEYGSFTKAAEILNYSQSAVSRMICGIEKEWCVTLLERGKSGVKLTSDGLTLLPYAKKLCGEYQRLQSQVDALNGLQTGIIRIGTFSSVATHWLPNIIKRFQADFPNIDYELLLGDYTEIEALISEGKADCGFLRMPAATELNVTFLEQDRFLAVLPENHRLAEKKSVSAAELCCEPFLMLQRGANAEVAEIFRRSGLSPQVRFTAWDDYAIMSMVENGLGVSILPELVLKRIPYRVALRPLDVPSYRSIGFAVRDKKISSLAVKKFTEYLSYRH